MTWRARRVRGPEAHDPPGHVDQARAPGRAAARGIAPRSPRGANIRRPGGARAAGPRPGEPARAARSPAPLGLILRAQLAVDPARSSGPWARARCASSPIPRRSPARHNARSPASARRQANRRAQRPALPPRSSRRCPRGRAPAARAGTSATVCSATRAASSPTCSPSTATQAATVPGCSGSSTICR